MHVKLAEIANAHAMLATVQLQKVDPRGKFQGWGVWAGVEKSCEDQCNIDAGLVAKLDVIQGETTIFKCI